MPALLTTNAEDIPTHLVTCQMGTADPAGNEHRERFFAEITRRRIGRGTFTDEPDLENVIHDYVDNLNRTRKHSIGNATL